MLDTTREETCMAGLLEKSARNHSHLCPRQVLGVRMGLYAGRLLDIAVPQMNKRLYTILESDGCFLDGVSVSTGCTVGARSMTIMDFGKIAATFIDRDTGKAIRIVPERDARSLCADYAAEAGDRWHSYLMGYQAMPVTKLFAVQPVELVVSLEKIISKSTARCVCAACGEEIFNEREIRLDGDPLLPWMCRPGVCPPVCVMSYRVALSNYAT